MDSTGLYGVGAGSPSIARLVAELGISVLRQVFAPFVNAANRPGVESHTV